MWEMDRTGEMVALAQIGTPAVPKLIEAIVDAEETAHRNIDRERCVGAFGIRLMCAKVLGAIGDALALPILERLLADTNNYAFWYEIQRIKKKNGMQYDTTIDN